ncbi:MAG TPA: rhodanese-like domain-containing protein [Actinomycetota bacterium]|nr:rhodanese-like domain-containing protein [Actinomycetota bacterium]
MIEQIAVTDLKALMDADGARLIDVREKWEYDNGHLPGAVWIPMSLVPLRRDEFAGPKPPYIVCRTGNRSGQVVMWLARQGIDAVNVAGGTEAWQRQGYPIDTFATERTR